MKIKEQIKCKLSDELFVKLRFLQVFGYRINLNAPKTFNEKLNWLKLYDRNPQYTNMVDKHKAKDYIKNIIGPEYIIPTLGVWDSVEAIELDMLPDRFVIKTTHDSGSVAICRRKATFDWNKTKAMLENSLKRNFYWQDREWPYKNIMPRIIAEEYLCDKLTPDAPADNWKFYCSMGEVFTYYCTIGGGHSGNLKMTFFDEDKNVLPVKNVLYQNSKIEEIIFPDRLDEMKQLAMRLSQSIPFLRVDFYYVNKKIYIGELTFYPGGGMEGIQPKEYEIIWGDCIKLPQFV